MIPKILDKFENEIGLLTDCIEGIAIEERNGMCEAEITYPIFSPNWNELKRGNIIVADVNDTLKNQKFRIYKVSKPLSGRIKVYARHIFFDLARDIIEEFELTNASCEYALNELFRRSQFSQAFKGYSDIINAQDYKMSTINLIKSIGGVQGSILDTYGTGAEILRDNRNIHVLNRRGHDNGITIEYSKNMTGLNIEFDDSNLITRIKAIAKYNDENNNEIIVKSNPEYVDSPLINNYETPFIQEIDFSQEFENDKIPTPSKLTELAEKYFRDNKCDQVKTNIKVEFIPLSKCVGYEDIQDKISLCDTVTIKDYRYNLDTQAKVIKTHYNFLNDRYEKMELGDPKVTLGNLVGGGNSGAGITGEETSKVPGINDSSFPNTLPTVPVLSSKLYGFDTIELTWTFESKTYYTYELYASKVKDFEPNVFDLLFKGNASTFLHSTKPSETWYYRVRAINTHGEATAFSNQVAVETVKIENLENYVANAAIGDALIGELNLGRGWFGQLRGNYIDAKQLSVTNGNGKRTLDIDSFGDVTLLPKNFKILVDGKEESVISQSRFNIAMNNINLSVGEIKTSVTETKESISEVTDNTNKIKTELKNDIKDVENSLSSLDSTMNGAFKDGVVNEAETKAINERLVQLDKEKTDLDVQYNAIITNSDLQGTAKTNITNAKNDFNSKYTDMKNYITSAISDKKVTEAEKTNINTKTKTYTTSLANLQKCFNEALDSISKIKADKAQTNANNHTNSEINKVVTTTNSKFSEIKATTDSISSKVSKVEEKTVAIDGKVTSHDKRIQNAEQKITPSAIVQSVTENFNNGGKVTTATMELNKNGLTTTSGSYKTSISNGVVTVRDKNSNNKTIELNNDIQIFNPTSGITSDFCGGIRRSISLDDNKKGLELTIDDGEDFLALSHITSGEGGIGDPSTYFVRMNRTGDVHIFRDVNFNNWNAKDIKINYKRSKETWMNDMYTYANQINVDYSSGNLCLNYWKGASAGTNSTKVYVNDGTNTGGRGVLYCKSIDAKSAFMQVQDTDLGRQASYSVSAIDDFIEDMYFSSFDENGECIITFNPSFLSQANTNMKYHVQVTAYEGSNCKIERNSTYIKIKNGLENEEVSIVIKARVKGQELVRYDIIEQDEEIHKWGGENRLLEELEKLDDKKIEVEIKMQDDLYKAINIIQKREVIRQKQELLEIENNFLNEVEELKNEKY